MGIEPSTRVTLDTKLLEMRRGCARTLDCGQTVNLTARKKVNLKRKYKMIQASKPSKLLVLFKV